MVFAPDPLWTFGHTVSADRAEQLLAIRSFDAVLNFLDTAVIIGFAWEAFRGARLTGCNRAEFLLDVAPFVYDAFFNSPCGYRAQFAIDPGVGVRANRELINRLSHKLLAYGEPKMPPGRGLLESSLAATDAKVWILESEVELHLGDPTPEIVFDPWQQGTTDGVGLRAPTGTRLEVKGGWIDRDGRERRDPYKATRGDDIHAFGYS